MTRLSSMVGSMVGPVSPDDLATFQRAGVATTVNGINRLGFPVWATSVRPFGAGKEAIGSVDRPVMRAGVNVSPGDVVVVAAAASVRTEREVGLRLAAEGGTMPGRVAGHLDGIDFDTGSG